MIFYHVEIARNKIIEKFIPKIPSATLNDEDVVTPRICVSKTIEGCLNAVSWGGSFFQTLPECLVYRVYVFDEEEYLDTVEISKPKYNVKDAKYTDECWILHEATPINNFCITNVKGEMKEIVLPTNNTQNNCHRLNIQRFEKIYYDIIEENIDCAYKIDISKAQKIANDREFFEFNCCCLIEMYFDIQAEFIDSISFDENFIYIESDFLFNKKDFCDILMEVTSNNIDLFENMDYKRNVS